MVQAKLTIQVQIGNRSYPITVSETERENVVLAAAKINSKIKDLEVAYKVKDPARRANDGWMSIKDFEWRNKEFTVVNNGRVLRRNNYAFQLGIGLPF